MKKTIKALNISVVFILMVSTFIACDKDFNVIDSDVLGKENFNFATRDSLWPITAYNRKTEAIQVNNLASHLLGIFNDPAYGQTKASIITQITPNSFDPEFGVNPIIDSVIISIPYFSTVNGADDDGFPTYRLDSLYGANKEDLTLSPKIKLTIYENGYFLRDFDPNNEEGIAQNYYSNASSSVNTALNGSTTIKFDDHIVGVDAPILNIEDFIPSNETIKTTVGTGDDAVTTRSEPAFRYPLDNDFWTKKIIEKEGDPVLSNANNFRNYFRGLYFKVEPIQTDGTMVQFSLDADASITMYYTNGEDTARISNNYAFNFTGNKLNTFINNYDIPLDDGDQNLGDAKLYLKGTEGSMAVVDLFNGLVDCDGDGNINDDALECFKNTFRQIDEDGEYIQDPLTNRYLLKRLINEAHLMVFEDEDLPDLGDENYHFYDRIYAYDIKNNEPTVDYTIDQTDNTQEPFNSKVISLGQRNPDNGKYKIRITEHLNNILINDSTNTKLGLVISTNVNYTNTGKILNSTDDVTEVPSATVLSPRGTIVFGSKETPSKEDKKLQLKIFFTESK
ncbi:DUF4270 domain-containing protein [Algibacter mikhailovii]|uniref:DUF4270 domain-containing protein n=1 Tax=Algibacter mikhailovii TaxID=425498 RepID=A0A918R3G6_9FLAO|nr:DUF4270 domain-containing protein [Algibacter mikhailovii]GGZ84570.1 hypothetical protein GCM10007028_23190 [Algibacter mikhailovii]